MKPKTNSEIVLYQTADAMPHADTEDQLVKRPAIRLFGELGYGVGHARRQLPQGAFTRVLA